MRTEKIGNYELNAWAVQAASKWLGYWNVSECMPGTPCRLIEECADGVYGFESSAELDAMLEALQFIQNRMRDDLSQTLDRSGDRKASR